MGTLFTALGAAAALAGTDIIPVHQGGARAVGLTGAQLLTYVGTTYVPLAGGTMTGALTIASGTLTASAPALSITQTWNSGAATFFGLDLSFTNTSIADAYPINVKVGGSSIFYLRYNGAANFVQNVSALNFLSTSGATAFGENYGVRNGSTTSVSWTSATATSGTTDLFLVRDSAATLAQRNGTNAQTLRVYGTADGAPGSNYQYLQLSANGTTGVTISAVGLGTPTANQDITLTPGGTGKVKFASGTFVNSNGYAFLVGIQGTYSGFDYSGHGVQFPTEGVLSWVDTGNFITGTKDTGVAKTSAGIVEINNGTAGTYRDLKLRNLLQTEYQQMTEMTAPAAPATNSVRIYAEDNGAGKTRLMALFATGAAQQLAIEP